jgi:tight adherence protein B
VIALLAGSTVLLLSWGLWCLYWQRLQERAVRERIRKGLDIPESPGDPLSRLRQAVNGLAITKGMERQLTQANISLTAADFYLIQLGAALVLALVLSRAFTVTFLAGLSMALVIVATGAKLMIRLRKGSLAQAVTKQLPDGVRMLANALHAGLSVRQGMSLVAREIPAPLGVLMQRTVQEIHLGAPLEEALDGLVQRVDSPDLQFVATTILLQHEMGGDLAGALDSVAAALVERLTVEGEVRTVTAEQRYVAMVLPVVPVMGVVFLNAGHPGYVEVLVRPLGVILLLVSGLLQGIGFYLIVRTARIKV